MKRNLIFRKEIDVSEKNELWCDKCSFLIKTFNNSGRECAMFSEPLTAIKDAKPFPETFLRCSDCLECEEQ